MNKKIVTITIQSHAFKGYANSYNVEVLNCFTLEVQLKNIESAIKIKLIDLLSESKYFKSWQ